MTGERMSASRTRGESMRFVIHASVFLIAAAVAMATASQPCPAFSVPYQDVTAVAVDERDVYFSQGGFVLRVPKEGGTPRRIVNLPDERVMYLALDDANVYFLARNKTRRTDGIYSVAKTGGPAARIVDIYAHEIIPEGEWLYLLCPGAGRILRVRKDATAIETLASGLRLAMGMVLDGDSIYFSETDPRSLTGSVRRVPKSGGRVTRVANVRGATALTHDEANLYVARLPERNGSIDAVSKSDGKVKNLVRGIMFETIEPLVVHRDSLYVGNMVGGDAIQLEAVRPSTGERRTIQKLDGGFPRFATDACGVYFITREGIERASP
jgi:hypothetical protein